jgi:hypothetical protein
MSDTIGSTIDKLFTVDMKLWNSQEFLYTLRKMNFEEFKEKYFSDDEGANILWEALKKTCDLNIQRNQLIDEIDEIIIQLVNHKFSGNDLDDGKFIQRKHKTL